jgi:hypothetical protein
MNFFCEKHGKNKRDAHFSNIGRFVEAESLVSQIKCSEDIVNAIHKRQNFANLNKKSEFLYLYIALFKIVIYFYLSYLVVLNPENFN